MKNSTLLALAVLCLSTTLAAAPLMYTATLNGASENPAVITAGIGTAYVEIDIAAMTLYVSTSFSGLTGTTTVAHIHCCIDAPGNVGVATPTPTFPGFPAGITSGTYSQSFDLTLASSFRSGFITANGGTPASAAMALANGLAAGQAYLNIHSTFSPGGEIRGFFTPVPEPSTTALTALPILLSVLYLRRRGARTGR